MIALAIILASLAAYGAVGYRLAVWDAPRCWSRTRQRHSSERLSASEARNGAALTLCFWPFRLPFLVAGSLADRYDPRRLEQERREQSRRIAALERELRITRHA